METNLNIAIDGPAGAGKSTVARMVAQKLGFLYIDTGAMYRAIALQALRDGINLEDHSGLSTLTANAHIRLKTGSNGDLRVFLRGEDVTEDIRSPEVSRIVSLVARVPAVRKHLVEMQRAMAVGGGVVMEGRDIGTVVLPNAKVKIFLTASPGERARRRREELAAKEIYIDQRRMEEEIMERDRIDSTRETDPLVPAADAKVIDCSSFSVEQVVNTITAQASAGR